MKRALGCLAPLILAGALLPVFALLLFAGGEQQPAAEAGSYGDGLKTAGIPDAVVPWIRKSEEQCDEVTGPLLAAQMKAESGFNPQATSSVGAQGISQFMPDTFKTWGRDSDGNGRASPFDIGDAIMAQGKMMCSLMKQVQKYPGDDVDLALAAYNAGAGAVKQYNGVPPYSETRAYIGNIKSYTQRFTASSTGTVALPLDPQSLYMNQNNWGSGGSRWANGHTGVDFSVACGTMVRAATSGTVVIETDQGWAGRWLVKISTGPGRLTTWYAHMQHVAVQDGQTVRAGDTLGQVGSEGNSTGCHLHFEYHPKGGSIYEDTTDPVPWLRNNDVHVR